MSLSKRLRTYFYNAVDLRRLDARVAPTALAGDGPIVSLTSVPKRIHLLKPTLVSLLRQRRLPKAIEINLGRDLFNGTTLPDFLEGLQMVRLHWVDRDVGPATKFIPALQRHEGSNRLLVICDDDMYYHPSLVGALVDADQAAGGRHAFCINGFKVPASLQSVDIPSDKAIRHGQRRVAVIEGCGGYTLRGSFIDAGSLLATDGAPARCLYDDDIWLSGQLSRRGIAKFQVPAGERRSLVNTIESAISGDRARLQSDVMDYFRPDWKPAEIQAP